MQLFYHPTISSETKQFSFDKQESRHIINVLRKRIGDHIQITNGNGLLLNTEIIDDNAKKCSVRTISTIVKPKTRNYKIHVAIAPTKLNDRFEWFLEKATEIGIDEISPIICERSERKVIKLDRIQKVIHSAAKQSLKYHWPKLNNAQSLQEFLKKSKKSDCFIAHCTQGNKINLSIAAAKSKDSIVLIGPEGDFSAKEIEDCLEHKFIPVSLGESRLRTETAGIVAVHTLALLNE